ncbi:ABC transporter ATP-binding protein [Anaeromicropila herbilytica]|uniref:ABC transporter ATP-binding protein n=1 Tax=Anaeromicropila herbilytica TaxID=2785025 RepID=A0A7R7IBR5_9FIRM|nr:ABC transporter ATP-binding protein [Anaeromicropila herbilytica]BCN29104.1 ABC transporter ATP-binding protein [Anaeromicropila herbilytica]
MLQVKHLYKSYQSGTIKYEVLKDVSFEVMEGEFVAVMGPSGSGKTTLLNCISCFIPYDNGEILLKGTSLSKLNEKQIAKVRNEKLGFVFQDFMLLDGLTVFENVCIPKIIDEAPYEEMEKKAENLLKLFGIDDIKDKYPAEISGGQKQRTAVARALMNNPFLILADEPTGNLDSKSSEAVIGAFVKAQKEMKATTFMVTHDSFSASYCDRVIVMKDGKIYKELIRSGSQRMFMDRLLEVLGAMNGGDEHDCK